MTGIRSFNQICGDIFTDLSINNIGPFSNYNDLTKYQKDKVRNSVIVNLSKWFNNTTKSWPWLRNYSKIKSDNDIINAEYIQYLHNYIKYINK